MNITIKSQYESHNLALKISDDKKAPHEILPSLYKIADLINSTESTLKTKDDEGITCKAGCGHCCRQMVPVSLPEAFHLKNVLEKLPKPHYKKIRTRFNKAFDTLSGNDLLTTMKNITKEDNIEESYFNLRIACPFLENEACMIYENRPFICREYLVTSRPDLCQKPYHNVLDKIYIQRALGALFVIFASRLYNMTPMPVPLIMSLYKTKEVKELEQLKWSESMMIRMIVDAIMKFNNDKITVSISGN